MKTTKITVELSTEQLALLTPACKSLGCQPGDLLLALAMDNLEISHDTASHWNLAASYLWRFTQKRETPRVEKDWADEIDFDQRFVRKDEPIAEPRALAASA